MLAEIGNERLDVGRPASAVADGVHQHLHVGQADVAEVGHGQLDDLGVDGRTGLAEGLDVSFSSGVVMGMSVVGLALLGGGALAAATAIWLLAWRRGLHSIRFVLVGVGVAYVCGSLLAWLMARAEVREAQTATLVVSLPLTFTFWLTGIALLKSLRADHPPR